MDYAASGSAGWALAVSLLKVHGLHVSRQGLAGREDLVARQTAVLLILHAEVDPPDVVVSVGRPRERPAAGAALMGVFTPVDGRQVFRQLLFRVHLNLLLGTALRTLLIWVLRLLFCAKAFPHASQTCLLSPR